ncbi:DNA repair protein rhp54 [Hordeum vulgare]|nr:DNA repair protein rhp54 [Hordeum vulgare]
MLICISLNGAARVAPASMTHQIPGFHVYPQASHLSEECSLEVSVVAPSTPAFAPVPVDLNATPVAGGSSSGGPRKRAREMSADMLSGARNPFDGMSAAVNDVITAVCTSSSRVMWRPLAVPPRLWLATIRVGRSVYMVDLDHVFPDDYGLEEEDEVDIDGDELTNQAIRVQPKRKIT